MGAMREIEVRAHPVGTIPLPEVSGLALGEGPDGQPRVLAIGDRAAHVAWAPLREGPEDLRWQVVDLAAAAGAWLQGADPQLEAIAADGRGRVLLVREHPNRAELLDLESRRSLSRIELEAPDSTDMRWLTDSWNDPGGSHAEGVVLLRGGRLLVVKEKGPAAVVEFAAAGESPLGFGTQRWLAPGEAWDVAGGAVTLRACAAWRPGPELRAACPDLSDAAVGMGLLLLLSDQGRAIAVVAPPRPGSPASSGELASGELAADLLLRLSGIRDKPEGLVVLPDGDLLVACDRGRVAENLYVVRRRQWVADSRS